MRCAAWARQLQQAGEAHVRSQTAGCPWTAATSLLRQLQACKSAAGPRQQPHADEPLPEGLHWEAHLRSLRLPIQGGLELFSASGNRFLAASSMMTARCGQNASARVYVQ